MPTQPRTKFFLQCLTLHSIVHCFGQKLGPDSMVFSLEGPTDEFLKPETKLPRIKPRRILNFRNTKEMRHEPTWFLVHFFATSKIEERLADSRPDDTDELAVIPAGHLFTIVFAVPDGRGGLSAFRRARGISMGKLVSAARRLGVVEASNHMETYGKLPEPDDWL